MNADTLTVFCEGVRIGVGLMLIIGTPVFLLTLLVLQLRESRWQYQQASQARRLPSRRATERNTTPGLERSRTRHEPHPPRIGGPGVAALTPHDNH